MAALAGSVPSPIYLSAPGPNRYPGLGQGLASIGDALTNVLQQRKEQQALAASQNMPPEEQVQYLMQKLGPQGIQFVNTLTNLRASQAKLAESQAQIAQTKAETTRSGLLSQALAFQNAHQGQTFALQQQAMEAEIRARNAAAAGEGARAAEEMQTAQFTKLRGALLQRQMDQTSQMTGALMQSLGVGGPQTPSAGGTPGATPPPSPRPQSYETAPGGVAASPAVERISDTGGGPQGPAPTPSQGGAAQPTQTTQGPSTEALLNLGDQLDRGADPTTNLPPYRVTLSPQQRMEILGYVSAGTPAELAKAAQAAAQAQQPTKVFKKETMPGFSAEFGLYSDGTAHAIPGTMEYNPKPTPEMANRFSEGIQQWYNTNEILKKLTNADPDGSGKDVMGNVGVRNLNAWLLSMHMQPIGDNATVRDIRTQAYTAYQHNVIGISQLGAGTRQTQRLIEMYREAMANPRDNKDVRNAKSAMSDLIAKIMVKDQVSTLAHAGERVPPQLRQLYSTMGLQGVSEDQLRQNFLSNYQLSAPPATSGATDITPQGGLQPTGDVREPPDFTDQYNTKLSPQQEQQFQAWLKQRSAAEGRDVSKDLFDYDLRGAWLHDAKAAANGHLPDTWKKPNEPTFSTQSIYSGKDGYRGGTWKQEKNGKWTYTPSETNIKMLGRRGLQQTFSREQQGSTLIMPATGRPTLDQIFGGSGAQSQ